MGKIFGKVQSQVKDNEQEIIDKVFNNTQNRCRCKITPKGLISFVVKSTKY